LQVKINKGGASFAGSNIYWVPDPSDATKGYLTFKPHGYKGEENNYQGVYFKWGSLVGVSPAGAWSDNTTPVYKYNGTAWEKTTASSWSAVPYYSSGTDNQTKENYFVDKNIQDNENGNNTGDICRFLGDLNDGHAPAGYRLPKSSEFNPNGYAATASITWNNGIADIYTRVPLSGGYAAISNPNDYGTTPFPDGAQLYGAFCPISGSRVGSGGLYRVNTSTGDVRGCYWSGSIKSTTETYSLEFSSSILYPGWSVSTYRDYALAIRCVKMN
jgi:hypothetical protein